MARTSKKAAKPENKEPAAAIKTFKASSEVEDLYTFIHENGLRAEAHKLMEAVVKHITPAKKRGRKKVLH